MPARLVDAGFRVIRHDNRDIGLSQHFDHLGVPNLVWASLQHRLGLSPKAPFALSDMAADAWACSTVAEDRRRARSNGVTAPGGMFFQRVENAAGASASRRASAARLNWPGDKARAAGAAVPPGPSHAHDDYIDPTVIGTPTILARRPARSAPW